MVKKTENNYFKLFSVSAIALLITLVFQWGISYFILQNNAYDTFYYFTKNSSTKVMMDTEGLISDMRNVAINISFDKKFHVLWGNSSPTMEEGQEISEKITEYFKYLNGINEIYIYNEKTDYIYSAATSDFSAKLSEVGDYNIPELLNTEVGENNCSLKFGVYSKSYTNMAYLAYYPFKKSKNAVIIRADFREFDKAFNNLRLMRGDYFWILDGQGKLFYGNESIDEKSLEKILDMIHAENKIKYQMLTYKKNKLMFDFSYSPLMDKYFIFAVPEKTLRNSEITKKNVKFVNVLLISLTLGLIMIIWVTKFIYTKYNYFKLKIENTSLNFNNQMSMSRETMLNLLLYSSEPISKENMNVLEDTKIKFNDPVLLILISIDDYKEFCVKFPDFKDRELYKYGVMNIICELLDESYVSEAISLENSKMVFFVQSSEQDMKNTIKIFQDAKEKISTYLEIKYTTALGKYVEYNEISELFFNLNNLLKYRYIYGEGANLALNLLKEHNDIGHESLNQKIFNLGSTLISGNIQKAQEEYDLIFNEISKLTVGTLQIYITMMVTMFNEVFSNLEKNLGVKSTFQNQEIIEKVLLAKKLGDVKEIFADILEDIMNYYKIDTKDKHLLLCKEVELLIQKNFGNLMLGLEFLADNLEISPNYLSRIFKANKNITIPNFILHYRLDMSKKLLENTGKNVNDISCECGFNSSSYFGVVFKKQFGVSPSVYREKQVKSE